MESINRVAIVTNNLICETNTKYYSMLERYFIINHRAITTRFDDADLVVFSTCGHADWMYQAICSALLELRKINFPEQNIIIMGCLPKTHEAELNDKSNGFNGRLIEFGKENLLDQIIGAEIPFEKVQVTNVFRAYGDDGPPDKNELYNIQVADGCLKQCTYCVINKAHGDIRSFPLAEIEEQYRTAIQKGYRNINLMAIDSLSYGNDTGTNIIELLNHLLAIESDVNLYLGPLHIRWLQYYWEGLLSLCKKGIINSLHIGLQHIDEELLKRMGRPVNFTELYGILCRFKQECPDLFISADIMVGFPGETEANFEALLDFFRKDKCFSMVNHYMYDDVKGAPSHKFDGKINRNVKMSRFLKLNDVLGARSPNIAFGKIDSPAIKRYRAAHQYRNEDGYYFCHNSFTE